TATATKNTRPAVMTRSCWRGSGAWAAGSPVRGGGIGTPTAGFGAETGGLGGRGGCGGCGVGCGCARGVAGRAALDGCVATDAGSGRGCLRAAPSWSSWTTRTWRSSSSGASCGSSCADMWLADLVIDHERELLALGGTYHRTDSDEVATGRHRLSRARHARFHHHPFELRQLA